MSLGKLQCLVLGGVPQGLEGFTSEGGKELEILCFHRVWKDGHLSSGKFTGACMTSSSQMQMCGNVHGVGTKASS